MLLVLKKIALFGMVALAAVAAAASNNNSTRKPIKVFGLGLSKTGTTSLADAMSMIGYETIHSDRALAPFMHHPGAPVNLTQVYDHVDAVFDIPTAYYYRELMQAYPDAKFILTVRSAEKWYKSFEKYHNHYLFYKWGCAVPERVQRMHEMVYGSRDVNPSWIAAMEHHNDQVQEFFKAYPQQLLVVDIEKDGGLSWDAICNFIESSDGPCVGRLEGTYPEFPRSNSHQGHHASQELACPKNALSQQSHSRYAYVMILCNADKPGNDEFLRSVLVLAEKIRTYDQESDIVVMFYGSKPKEYTTVLNKMGIKTLQVGPVGGRVEIPDPFGQVEPSESACFMAKLRALQMTQYERIMYIDSDILFQADPTSLFELPSFVGNGGLYVMTPSNQAFADLRDLANSGGFNKDTGWMDVGHFEDWRKPGVERNWTFWCAHSDQGIVYYYYDKLLNDANISTTFEFDWLFIHFAGKNKPFLMDPANPKSIKKRFRNATLEWFSLWDNVSKKLAAFTDLQLDTKSSIEQAREVTDQRFLQADPYDEDDENECTEECLIGRYIHWDFGGPFCFNFCVGPNIWRNVPRLNGFWGIECNRC